MIKLNFIVFLGLIQLTAILLIVAIVQIFYIKKYRPYYQANTTPQQLLRKIFQRLIKQTQEFGKSLKQDALAGDDNAIDMRRNLTARLNWLIIERDFSTTHQPDAGYWQDINKRIKNMLSRWLEIKTILAPPDIQSIELSIDSNEQDFIDFGEMDIEEVAKERINTLTKRVEVMSDYEKMYIEMEYTYKALEASYNELMKGIRNLKLEAKEAEKLRILTKQQKVNEEKLNQLLSEVQKSKDRLVQELEQLETAYLILESEINENENKELPSLSANNDPETKELQNILNNQDDLLLELKKALAKIKMEVKEKDIIDKHTSNISKTNKEVNHCLQMLELERERLTEELAQLQAPSDFS